MTATSSDTRIVTVVFAALALLVLLPLLFMGGGMMGYMGFGPMMGGQGGMFVDGAVPGWLFVVSAVMQLAFLAAVVGGVYLVYRALTGGDEDDALAELRLAYARGDIDDDEYERRRAVLERE